MKKQKDEEAKTLRPFTSADLTTKQKILHFLTGYLRCVDKKCTLQELF